MIILWIILALICVLLALLITALVRTLIAPALHSTYAPDPDEAEALAEVYKPIMAEAKKRFE